MKDSQDWLGKELDRFGADLVQKVLELVKSGEITLDEPTAILYHPSLSAEAKSAIRKHFLQEALEMIDSQVTPPFPVESEELRMLHEGGVLGYDLAKQELRNKFNDKYKED